MDLFNKAKAVRLRSHHDKYLYAEQDEESVCQDRSGASRNARWTVELVEQRNFIRLKSCYGRYLTASNEPFLLGVTGRKVLQTLPRRLDSSVEWEPIREGFNVKLKTHYGNFLRGNGGLPPWRNSVTHDIPHRTATQDWVLWEVDVVEIRLPEPSPSPLPTQNSLPQQDPSQQKAHVVDGSEASDPAGNLSRLTSLDSLKNSPPKSDGRLIYYAFADENGDVDDTIDWNSFLFKGTNLDQLLEKVEEETELQNVIICSHNPLNGKLYPLRLQLPPNNAAMRIVLVEPSSRLAKEFS
ncbi:hypothetical protein EJ110_NYTH06040 [Nymphaea thermarum]|nr:hypothetical protein EJ110_NYTH06040 [Nymphaea thermarum]